METRQAQSRQARRFHGVREGGDVWEAVQYAMDLFEIAAFVPATEVGLRSGVFEGMLAALKAKEQAHTLLGSTGIPGVWNVIEADGRLFTRKETAFADIEIVRPTDGELALRLRQPPVHYNGPLAAGGRADLGEPLAARLRALEHRVTAMEASVDVPGTARALMIDGCRYRDQQDTAKR